MQAYIYVTYASEDRTRAEHFCQILSRYGFRYRSACEQHETARRAELLRDSALVVALTSKAAEEAETVASDIRLALERQEQILCISLEDNPLDHRFCTEADDAVSLIRYPAEDTPTRHTASQGRYIRICELVKNKIDKSKVTISEFEQIVLELYNAKTNEECEKIFKEKICQ